MGSIKWIIVALLFIISLGFISAYTPPLYTNVTIVLDNSYTVPVYTNVTIVLGEELGGPSVIFNTQVPADITSLNVVNNPLNITYNITSLGILNTTSPRIFYKSNSTTRDIITFINGTGIGLESKNYTSNVSSTYLFQLFDNEIYPGTYNLNDDISDNLAHTREVITNSQNSWMAVQLLNVTNSTQYNFYEIMSNSTAAQRLYYCNSSYNFGADTVPNPSTSPRCTLFNTIPANTPYAHCHTPNSCHQVATLTINTTTGRVNTVVVTPTSWFLSRGTNGAGNTINYYTVTTTVRQGIIRTSTNSGGTWTNQTNTTDAHLHQFSGNSSLWYYVCANNTDGLGACSELRQDLFDLGGLPPTAPGVYAPTGAQLINSQITINYTASTSPNGYPIVFYNISLLNSTFGYVQSIIENNSVNLSYIWNSTGVGFGTYYVQVVATDNNSLTGTGTSQFEIENISMDYSVNLPLGFIRYLNCSPDFENPVSQPEGQTALVWALNITNNGNITEDMQIRINQTAATGWKLYSSNLGTLASPTLLSTTYQTIFSSVAAGEVKNVWLYANCSFINSNSRTYIELRGA